MLKIGVYKLKNDRNGKVLDMVLDMVLGFYSAFIGVPLYWVIANIYMRIGDSHSNDLRWLGIQRYKHAQNQKQIY